METFAPKTPMYPLFLSLNGLDCLLVDSSHALDSLLPGVLFGGLVSILAQQPSMLQAGCQALR